MKTAMNEFIEFIEKEIGITMTGKKWDLYQNKKQELLEKEKQSYILSEDEVKEWEYKDKWIDVKDKMPEEGEMVLCYREADTLPNEFYQEVGAFSFYNNDKWGAKESDNWNVTYWKPLPIAPTK